MTSTPSLGSLLAHDETVRDLVLGLNALDERYYGARDGDAPLATILATIAPIAHLFQAHEARAALVAMPDEQQAILARFVAVSKATRYALEPRRTHETDDAAYLAGGLDTFETLFVALIKPQIRNLAGLRTILTSPNLDRDARVAAVLALDPHAAELCSEHLADGRSIEHEGRFYPTTSGFDPSSDWLVMDRDTNQIVHASKGVSWADAMVKAMNDKPEIGEKMSALAAERTAQGALSQPHLERYRTEMNGYIAELAMPTPIA